MNALPLQLSTVHYPLSTIYYPLWLQELSDDRPLLIWLVAGLYVLLTLLPDSSTLVLSWPWVLLWQAIFVSAIAWFLLLLAKGRLQRLGWGLDALAGLFLLNLTVSTLCSPFAQQAFWHSFAAVGLLAALYALSPQLKTPKMRERLLTGQGYLNIVFIVESLLLWSSQTYLPELQKLQQFQRLGVDLDYDFSILELRNWAPIGHQNYVAGYLLLALPLLTSLAILQRGWRRWLWGFGILFGLVDLYTTSSRGGWLGLAVLVCCAGASFGVRSRLSRWKLGAIFGGAIVAFLVVIVTNNRFLSLVSGLLKGEGSGELSYRIITAVTGWKMGASQWWMGTGLGSVPLLYQKFRPFWAGREAELAFQLHSTPVQIWAELGLLGIGVALGTLAVFVRKCAQKLPEGTAKSDRLFRYSLCSAVFAYSLFSLTDFQLDLVPITGTSIVYVAVLGSLLRGGKGDLNASNRRFPIQAIAATIALFSAIIWLVPVYRSWQLSSEAFLALSPPEPQVDRFVSQLDRAVKITPWEPYYPYQLAWQLAELGNREEAIANFKIANTISPYREFGQSNLGWLQLQTDPEAATASLARSAQLVPSKKGVFYNLGLSFLARDEEAKAIEALTLEILRDPPFVTSPIWQDSLELRDRVFSEVDRIYTQWLEDSTDRNFNRYLHQVRGAMRWWQGNFDAATEDWENWGSLLQQTVLELTDNSEVNIPDNLSLPTRSAIAAWQHPDDRLQLLQQAWIAAERQLPPDDILQGLMASMASAESLYEWLAQDFPILAYRRTRSGFGVLSRHTDGIAPRDFPVWVENVAIDRFFEGLFPSLEYYPPLDTRLQPRRDRLNK